MRWLKFSAFKSSHYFPVMFQKTIPQAKGTSVHTYMKYKKKLLILLLL